jgi:hypothetical protein
MRILICNLLAQAEVQGFTSDLPGVAGNREVLQKFGDSMDEVHPHKGAIARALAGEFDDSLVGVLLPTHPELDAEEEPTGEIDIEPLLPTTEEDRP